MNMIKLMAYNPEWQFDFLREKDSLTNLGIANIVTIEHIGSTAIKGMLSKPVIDILVGVKDLATFVQADIQRIETLGYRYNSVFESVFPFRRYFQKNDLNGERTHQIHLVNYPSQWFEKHILFRDYLGKDHTSAKAYESLKLELAKQFDNTLDYANAKDSFCQEIDKKAFMDETINHPHLESKRLKAHIPQLACYEDYAAMLQNKEFCITYGVSYNYEEALLRLQSDMDHWNQYAFAPFMWYEKKTNNYIGRGGLKYFKRNPNNVLEVELTYQIKREYWNQGFAQEIGHASIDYAFNKLNLKDIICFTAYKNDASLKVMQKLHFGFEEDFLYAGMIHKLHRLRREIDT